MIAARLLSPWLAVLALCAASPAHAAPPATAQEIIAREGRFVFTDGSSYYAFERGGSFHSGPVGMSGRTIAGTWTHDGSRFVVEGQWGWVNGLSANNDWRRLKLGISNPRPTAAASGGRPLTPLRPVKGPLKVYGCYHVVDELVRLPATALTTLHGRAADAKGGAVVVGAKGVVYVRGLDSWSGTGLAGKEVVVTGVLRRIKLIPSPRVDKNGAIGQGAEGNQSVIEGASWRAAK